MSLKRICIPVFIFLNISLINCGSVLTTEVFEIVIDQAWFNWTNWTFNGILFTELAHRT